MRRGVLADYIILAVLHAALCVFVRRHGFDHVSDDDFARVVISQAFAHKPKLDPSGTSWLPFPFWLQGRGVDTTTAVSRLLFSGHFVKYAGMTMVLSHGGGAIPYMMGRLERNCAIHPGEYASVADGFGRLYFDSVLFDPATLAFLCGKVGAGRVVLGSDYPFPIGDLEPCKIVRNAPLSEGDRRLILGETARKLFRLSQ